MTALALAQHEAAVASATRSASEIEEVAAMIRTNGRKALAVSATLLPELVGEETAQRMQQMCAKGAFQIPERPARFITVVAATADTSLNGHIIDISSEEG